MALTKHEEVRYRLEVLMTEVDDYDPEDAAAEARSYTAKELAEAANAIEQAAQEAALRLRENAIRILEGN